MELLNVKTLLCPEPVMMVRKAVRKMKEGEQLKILATDPSTQRDLPAFCMHMDHTLVEQSANDGVFTFVIQKGNC
ncbi:sulfurtransferase TusA [Vibrio breoganii]|uniref:sulfurtransferase TusA n=1 Tax=Vibrio breoganii TaxID=553239 RepID=UPI000C861905|nr:sulfurtransferase TusA [Vibrio breoganii]PML13951.1 sulfurtransferase TusA [Vibrio breoganii]